MQLSIFASPVCAACASRSCPGALAPASCAVVVAVAAHFAAIAPDAVIPVERAILGAVACRLAGEAGAPAASCPACGRRVVGGSVAKVGAFLAGAPARLAPGSLGRRGLWCPICARVVLPSSSPKLAARVRRWLASS